MRISFLCLLIASLFSACGEFSYKQGAGLHELDNAKQACRSTDKENAEKCLQTHGWYIHKFDDANSFTNDEINDHEPEISENKKTAVAHTEADLNLQLPTKQTPSINQTEPTRLQKTSPSQSYKISSWWKIGASDKMMKMDLEQCAASLGKEHEPKIAEQRYTRALIHCMNEKDWQALGATK